jgi:lipopolysaccharide biosynthesis protein
LKKVEFLNECKSFIRSEKLLRTQLQRIRANRILRERGASTRAVIKPSIVIHVHMFHRNYVRRLRRTVRNFPSALILVSVPTEEVKVLVQKKLRRYINQQEIEILVVENKGRNFGPMINRFSARISQREILIHVHSKDDNSSLYRWMWSYLLWRELTLNKSSIQKNISKILETNNGILIPFSLRWMPSKHFSWLGNYELAEKVFPKILSNSSCNAQFFYPIGGMFMSKVEAIRPILDSDLLKESFVPEKENKNAYLNGITAEHMVERALGVIPILLGFNSIIYFVEDKNYYKSQDLMHMISSTQTSKQ